MTAVVTGAVPLSDAVVSEERSMGEPRVSSSSSGDVFDGLSAKPRAKMSESSNGSELANSIVDGVELNEASGGEVGVANGSKIVNE